MKKDNNHKKDYSKEDLPKTRTEQFWRLLKDNFFTIFKLGLLLLVAVFPLIVAVVMKNINLSYIDKNETMSEIEKIHDIASINVIFAAIFVPCIMFFFLELSGILKILRRLIWDEPLFFKDDFFLGIKESAGQFLLFGFLIGIVNFFSILTYYTVEGWLKYLSYVMFGVSFAIFIPIILVAAYISSIYKNKVSISLSVSLKLFFRRGIFTILVLVVLYSVYFLSFIPMSMIVYLAIIFALIIILFPIWVLISYINCIKNLDDYVNVYYYPDKAYLGLYVNKENMDSSKGK